VAAQSQELSSDPILQGLLAYQSYRFHTRAGGPLLEKEVYMGLYAAMKKLISPAYNMYQGIRTSVKDIQWLNRTGSLIIAASDGSLKILSGNYVSTSSQIDLRNTGVTNECMIISPDEGLAVVGTNGGGLLFVELENQGNLVQQNTQEGNIFLFLSGLGSSGNFVSAGTDNRILLWDYQFGQAEPFINTHARVSALTASENGRSICYGTRDGKLFELNVAEPGTQTQIADYGRAHARAIAYSPSGRSVVVGLRDGSLQVLSGSARQRLATLRGPQASINDIAFSPDGRFLAAVSNDGNVYLWSTNDWSRPPLVFDENNGFVLSVCFSANSGFFYTGSVDFPRLVGRPSDPARMVDNFCSLVDRNLSQDEWELYFGTELPYERTCTE
jgi:WD40 repeat protein